VTDNLAGVFYLSHGVNFYSGYPLTEGGVSPFEIINLTFNLKKATGGHNPYLVPDQVPIPPLNF
jgi:hypothetical protein